VPEPEAKPEPEPLPGPAAEAPAPAESQPEPAAGKTEEKKPEPAAEAPAAGESGTEPKADSEPQPEAETAGQQEAEPGYRPFSEENAPPIAKLVIEEDTRVPFLFGRFMLGIFMLLISAAALAAAAYFGRFYLVTKYGEPFRSWCQQLNIDCAVSGTGLEIKDLSIRMFDGVLTVQGAVQNLTDREQPLPPIVLGLRDEKNRDMQSGLAENMPASIPGLGRQQFTFVAEMLPGVENGIVLFWGGDRENPLKSWLAERFSR